MASFVGQQLGSYRLVDILGHGAFATVYLGEHIRLHTRVAIKVLDARLMDDSVEQFLAEAQIIAHLSHPHIVRVFDFNVENGSPYLVEDFAPNGTLRQLHPGGTRLRLDIVVNYTKQIADALQYAHNQRVIHRDVKPQNLLLGPHNEILLCDFGIATVTQSSRLANMQDIAGTAPYMAPEQFKGQPRRASDQYALAIVVYEWLSGAYPFQGSFTEIASQQLFVPPPPLRRMIPTLSPGVEEVISIALAKEPEQRFASVYAFANALEQAAKDSSSLTYPSLGGQFEKTLPAQPFYPAGPVTGQEERRFHSDSTLPASTGGMAPIRNMQKKPEPSTTAPRPVRTASPMRKWIAPGGIVFSLILIASLLILLIPRGLSLLSASPTPCEGFSDHFQQNDLGGWSWQDPGNASTYDLNNAQHYLHLSSTGGSDEDLNPKNNTNAPRILQTVDGNFSIETQIDFVQRPQSFQGAALLIWINQGQFLRLEISAWDNKYYGINFVYYNMADTQNWDQDLGTKLLATPPTVKLRLKRVGSVFSAEWQQGTGGWSAINKTYTITSGPVQAGLTLMNSKIMNYSGTPAEAYFHYFHFTCLNT